MPPFEMIVIVRNGLKRPDLKDALKRLCGHLHSQGGVIRSMENMGEKPLPMPIRTHSGKYEYGNYFCMKVHLPSDGKPTVSKLLRADGDLLNHTIFNDVPEPDRPCLYKQCVFGEVVRPTYDKSMFKQNTIRHLKNKRVLK